MAGFGETNGFVYAKFHKSIIYITVLYELIKGITVLYMPNQAHNCTVWLIQYSYAVDYYCMNYTAHFFALILPCKVQYDAIGQCFYPFCSFYLTEKKKCGSPLVQSSDCIHPHNYPQCKLFCARDVCSQHRNFIVPWNTTLYYIR